MRERREAEERNTAAAEVSAALDHHMEQVAKIIPPENCRNHEHPVGYCDDCLLAQTRQRKRPGDYDYYNSRCIIGRPKNFRQVTSKQ